MVVGADGAGARPLVRHEALGQIVENPFWTPDGKAVLYNTYTPTYKAEEVTVEAVEVRRFDVAASSSATIASGAQSPAVSRDGRWIAFVGDDPELGPSLRLVPSGGGAERTLVAVNEFLALMAPRFSPDGQTIAFGAVKYLAGPGAPAPRASTPLDLVRQLLGPGTAIAHGMPWEIWTVPTAGGALRQLTRDTLDTPYPAWSSDGARILVYGANGVHLVDVASGRAEALSAGGTHGGMDWRSGS
jgi:Tol biopolymer transport system component